MSKVISIFSVLLFFNIHSKDVDLLESSISWHLYIEKNTNVYGDVEIKKGTVDLKNFQNTEFEFNLLNTKSYELDNGKKSYSEGRDKRIFYITDAKKAPSFKGKVLIHVKGHDYIAKGTLVINEVAVAVEIPVKIENNVVTGRYGLSWNSFKISDPIMWFMKAFKTADDNISIKFKIKL